MQQSRQVEGLGVEARHVGVAEDEIHVVDGVDAAEQRTQLAQPVRVPLVVIAARAANQPGDLSAGRALPAAAACRSGLRRIPRSSSPRSRSMIAAADVFVRDAELVRGNGRRRNGRTVRGRRRAAVPPSAPDFRRRPARERWGRPPHSDSYHSVDHPRGQVHHPQDVLKPLMLGRRKDPPRGLQLVDLPHPLHPGMVDDLLFGDFVRRAGRAAR